MKDYAISFYKNFKCIGGECPHTCCQGWKILVDNKTYDALNNISASDPVAAKCKSCVTTRYRFDFTRDTQRLMRHSLSGKCVCLSPEGLCEIQKTGRDDLMPTICKNYPRRIMDLGKITETTLELSCPEVARLFIEQGMPMKMEEITLAPFEVNWTIGNEDDRFYDFLMELRDNITHQIESLPAIDGIVLNRIYTITFDMHHEILRDNLEDARDLLHGFAIGDKVDRSTDYMFYPMEIMDKVIAYNICPQITDFNHKDLRKIIKYYFKCFDKLTDVDARTFYSSNYKIMSQEISGLEEKYKSYYIYYLYEMLMSAYEDYHILRVIMLGNMYLQIYRVLDMVAWLMAREQGVKYDTASQVALLSNLERRMRHNLSITDGIMERIRREFLSDFGS